MKKNYKDYIEIKTEKFYIEQENDIVYLVHPYWSMVGMGKTLYAAEINLINEAKELFNILIKEDNSRLSLDALAMKSYLFNII